MNEISFIKRSQMLCHQIFCNILLRNGKIYFFAWKVNNRSACNYVRPYIFVAHLRPWNNLLLVLFCFFNMCMSHPNIKQKIVTRLRWIIEANKKNNKSRKLNCKFLFYAFLCTFVLSCVRFLPQLEVIDALWSKFAFTQFILDGILVATFE